MVFATENGAADVNHTISTSAADYAETKLESQAYASLRGNNALTDAAHQEAEARGYADAIEAMTSGYASNPWAALEQAKAEAASAWTYKVAEAARKREIAEAGYDSQAEILEAGYNETLTNAQAKSAAASDLADAQASYQAAVAQALADVFSAVAGGATPTLPQPTSTWLQTPITTTFAENYGYWWTNTGLHNVLAGDIYASPWYGNWWGTGWNGDCWMAHAANSHGYYPGYYGSTAWQTNRAGWYPYGYDPSYYCGWWSGDVQQGMIRAPGYGWIDGSGYYGYGDAYGYYGWGSAYGWNGYGWGEFAACNWGGYAWACYGSAPGWGGFYGYGWNGSYGYNGYYGYTWADYYGYGWNGYYGYDPNHYYPENWAGLDSNQAATATIANAMFGPAFAVDANPWYGWNASPADDTLQTIRGLATQEQYTRTTADPFDPAAGDWYLHDLYVAGNAADTSGTPADSGPDGYSYDAAGAAQTIADAAGDTLNFGYNAAGQLTTIHLATPSDIPSTASGSGTTDASSANASSATAPAGDGDLHFTYTASGSLASLTDPDGNTTTWTYDTQGNLTQETDQAGDSRSYSYDAAGNLLRYDDRDGRVRVFTYHTVAGQTLLASDTWYASAADADAQQNPQNLVQYQYDAAGRLTSESDNSSSYTYTYDSLGRQQTITVASPDAPTVLLTAQYTGASAQRTGLTATLADGTLLYDLQYTYDAQGRVTTIHQSGGSLADVEVDFAYDSTGNLSTATRYQGGKLAVQADYTYDSSNRLTGLSYTQNGTTLASYSYTYDDASTGGTAGPAVHSFDWGDPLDVPAHTTAGIHPTQIDTSGFAASRLTSVTSVDGTVNYTYDPLGQLLSASYSSNPQSPIANPSESYAYDANGNRTGSGYEIGLNNELLSDGTYNYTYDADGNRVTRTDTASGAVTRYTWDARNRFTAVTDYNSRGQKTQEVHYDYDLHDRWIGEKVTTFAADGQTATNVHRTSFIYDGNQIVLQFESNDVSTPSTLTHRYLWGSGVDQLLSDEQIATSANGGTATTTSTVAWPLADNLGTIRDLATSQNVTDATTGVTTFTTTVVNHRVYDSYGNLLSQVNPATGNAPTVDCLFGFTSRPLDKATELQNNLHRWYDAKTGGWLSVDPTGYGAGDGNARRYCGNDPVRGADPSGCELIAPSIETTKQILAWFNAEVGVQPIVYALPGGFYHIVIKPEDIGKVTAAQNKSTTPFDAQFYKAAVSWTFHADVYRDGDVYKLQDISNVPFSAVDAAQVAADDAAAGYKSKDIEASLTLHVTPESSNWVRARGLVRWGFGLTEIAGGAALTTGGTATEGGSLGATTVVSVPVALAGIWAMYRGKDDAETGGLEMWTGVPQESELYHVSLAISGSPTVARVVEIAGDFAGGAAAAKGMGNLFARHTLTIGAGTIVAETAPEVISVGKSSFAITVKNGVATVIIEYVHEIDHALVDAMLAAAKSRGAKSMILNTGSIHDIDLAIKLGQAAQTGRTIAGGVVKLVSATGTTQPAFQIVWDSIP